MISDFFYYERLIEERLERKDNIRFLSTNRWVTQQNKEKHQKYETERNDKKKRDMKTLKVNDHFDDEGKHDVRLCKQRNNTRNDDKIMLMSLFLSFSLMMKCHWTQWWWDASNLPFLNFDICILAYLSCNTMVDDKDKDWTMHSSQEGKVFKKEDSSLSPLFWYNTNMGVVFLFIFISLNRLSIDLCQWCQCIFSMSTCFF